MPNIHETIKQLAISAGGPGSGRRANAIDFHTARAAEHDKLAKMHQDAKGKQAHEAAAAAHRDAANAYKQGFDSKGNEKGDVALRLTNKANSISDAQALPRR